MPTLTREEAIRELSQEFSEIGVDWESFDPFRATSSDGECLLWLISCRLNPVHKARFLRSFAAMTSREYFQHTHKRATKGVLQERMKLIVALVKKKHPEINTGQLLPPRIAAS